MKIASTFLLTVVAAVAMSGCTSQFTDIQIDTRANPEVNLGTYRTYAWVGAAAMIVDPDNEWTPSDLDVGAEIRFLVDRELRKNGLAEVVDNPDVLVAYGVGIDMKAMKVVIDEDQTERFENLELGGVLVALADATTREVVWGGSAVAKLLEEPDRDLTRQRLDYAITEMFKKFPYGSEPLR